MHRCRSRPAQLLLWIGLVAWVLGLCARVAHDAEALHTVCSQHGELIERDQSAPAVAVGKTVEIRADKRQVEHNHDCALQGIQVHATPWTTPTLLPPAICDATTQLAQRHWTEPARGPPLSWAPKTSPPLA